MRMIPGFIDDDTPPGERMVFASLQNSDNNGVAIHSLDLAPYNRSRRTEIDFLVIIPAYGILCIEVKSQRDIKFDGDRWYPETIKKSPFKQALDARYAFYRSLKRFLPQAYHEIPILHLCIFPRSSFIAGESLATKACEYIDRDAYDACSAQNSLIRLIENKMNIGIEGDPDLKRLQAPINQIQVDAIVNVCSPIRRRQPEKSEEINRRQSELEAILRVQQKPVLQLCSLNDRVVVEGGAGTGKSLIGLEIAKRKAEAGLRVACICYNRLVGKWIESEIGKANNPRLIGGSIYKLLLAMTDTAVPENPSADWWSNECINLIQEKLTDPEFKSASEVDYLVIDEAQDILARPALSECVKMLVNGGLKDGAYLILGDFLNQSLTIDLPSVGGLIEKSSRWKLEENCRNYASIGRVALTLSGSDSGTWKGYMRGPGILDDWNVHYYNDDAEQVEMVHKCIKLSHAQGYKDNDITVLTFCSLQKSILNRLAQKGLSMEQAEQLDSDSITYSTISAFKGMDNKVIIITDVVLSPQNKDLERRLFYTAMTRATEKLHMVCRHSSMEMIQSWAFAEG